MSAIDDLFDSYDPADDDEEGVTCRCGQTGLDWIHTGERYRLVAEATLFCTGQRTGRGIAACIAGTAKQAYGFCWGRA